MNFQRLKGTGINLGVIIISIVVFFIALFVVMGLANAQKPDTMDILAAAQDLSVGHVLTSQDLVVKTVFVDDNTALYIPANEEGTVSLLNGIVVVPMFVGQPIMRTSVVAEAAGSERLSAALVNYPAGGSLFPLPLDFANVVAPSVDSFMPGDLVNITVVISSRPQPPVTPTVMPEFITGSEPYIPVAPQVIATNISMETDMDKAKALLYPPMAKDLFPEGVRVIEVQGGTQKVDADAASSDTVDPAAGYVDFNQPKALILLIPDKKREELSLALQEGDALVVSLLSIGNDSPTEGFSYWDYEEWMKAQREQAMKDALSTLTAVPGNQSVLPSPTPTVIPVTPTATPAQ
ncbi:MAG TPA: SAF domain-containing protein [Oculatellaceae cyanobacterium]